MLIIAISHGAETDPFTTSKITRSDTCLPEPVDANDAKACLDWICKEKDLRPEWIDEILVVSLPDYDADPEVIHHFSSVEGDFGDEEENEDEG